MENKFLFTLGNLFVSDFLKPDEEPRHPPVEMKLMLNDDNLVHLEKMAPRETMWGEHYWYRSSINATMRKQLMNVVESIADVFPMKDGDVFLDIASNDGFLLSCVPSKFSNLIKIGCDPANDSFRLECEKYADLVIQDYFSAETFKSSKYGHKKVKCCTTISMFYDIVNYDKFIQDIVEVLDNNGLWVVQCSYTPLMVQGMAWDNICHEHYAYWSLFNLKPVLERNGLQVMDVTLDNTNAGSFRVYCMKQGADTTQFGSQTHRDVCRYRINSLLSYERTLRLDEAATWISFKTSIDTLKEQTLDFLKKEIAAGKTIMGYGASTKGMTVLGYFGLDSSTITAIADRSPYKHGLRTIAGNIPIISEDEMRAKQPDYLLVLPFHFIQEFVERESEYLSKGGKMIVLCPKFEIISK